MNTDFEPKDGAFGDKGVRTPSCRYAQIKLLIIGGNAQLLSYPLEPERLAEKTILSDTFAGLLLISFFPDDKSANSLCRLTSKHIYQYVYLRASSPSSHKDTMIPSESRQYVVRNTTDSDSKRDFSSLRLKTQPVPPVGDNDVLIRIHAVTLNWRDVMVTTNTYLWPILEGTVPCSDDAGEGSVHWQQSDAVPTRRPCC